MTTTAALVIFWPAAFFVKGDGATAAELSRLKGEMETIERVADEKGCGITFARPPPPPPPQMRRPTDKVWEQAGT